MRKVLTILLVGALLLATVPAVVFAADSAVTGSGKGGNTLPTATNVMLVDVLNAELLSMDPLTEHYVTVDVGDVNTIDDIDEIYFYIHYGTLPVTPAWDADEVGIFKWTKSGDVWSMENGGASTTWNIVSIDCVTPSTMSNTSDEWKLAFKPGELAQQAASGWDVTVKAYDEAPQGGSGNWGGPAAGDTGSAMTAYNAVVFGQATITLGDATLGIEPGDVGYITNPITNYLTVNVTSNASYSLGVHSADTWGDGGSNTITLSDTGASSGEFALAIDNQEAPAGEAGEPTTPQIVPNATTGSAIITGYTTASRVVTSPSAGEGTTDANLYMSLTFAATGIQEVTYSGDVTFTVTN